jgi:hypothetical protein
MVTHVLAELEEGSNNLQDGLIQGGDAAQQARKSDVSAELPFHRLWVLTPSRGGAIRRSFLEPEEKAISLEAFVEDLDPGDSFVAAIIDLLVRCAPISITRGHTVNFGSLLGSFLIVITARKKIRHSFRTVHLGPSDSLEPPTVCHALHHLQGGRSPSRSFYSPLRTTLCWMTTRILVPT